jgi:hypothetical protein
MIILIFIKILDFLLERIRNQTTHLIQDCDIHLKKCINFISTLVDIQNDSTRISKDKLEQLKVKLFFA